MVSFRVIAWKKMITLTAEDAEVAEVLYLTERTEALIP